MESTIKYSGSMPESASQLLFNGAYSRHKESLELSPYQQKLFSVALNGFHAFSTQEVAAMSVEDRKTIMRCFGKTKKVLNELTQEYMTNTVSQLFNRLFPNAKGSGLSILMQNIKDPYMDTNLRLNIPKKVLIKRLIAESILPKDFLKCAA